MSYPISNFAIAGYRSFGSEPQYLERFNKINLFIGKNNSGKSNLLRFICEIYAQAGVGLNFPSFDTLARHIPLNGPLVVGIGEGFEFLPDGKPTVAMDNRLILQLRDKSDVKFAAHSLGKIFSEKAKNDGTQLCWSLYSITDKNYITDSWTNATRALTDAEISYLWRMMRNMSGGGRGLWEEEVVALLSKKPSSINSTLIPAIRRIGDKGSISNGFDGTGIIERLAKLQNPDVHSQKDRERFNAVTNFLRDVTDRPDAKIEIPYDRDTILVHMDGKVLPIESLGSGIHELIILAAAATVLTDHVVCIEEPELHLNPILQRKLVRYLERETNNQYFITTHSAALMDTPNAEIYHVQLVDGCSKVDNVTSDTQRSMVCEDLGYHPSDLLQANSVIWVEGPSDRIYLNWWIRAISPEFIEGIHYSVMFYGGRLASHLSNALTDTETADFISLRRLNRRGVIVMDSDKDKAHARINSTKQRLQNEFNDGPGHAWITDGREVENYIDVEQLQLALKKVSPNSTPLTKFEKYDNCMSVKLPKGGDGQAPKVEVAKYITENFQPELSVLDLKSRLEKLKTFIAQSNPKLQPTA
jgi:predicted ATPase